MVEMNQGNVNTRRKLAVEELRSIADRLETLSPSIAEGYEYPLSHLIANLRESGGDMENYVELDRSGTAVLYYLNFSSPAWTWEALCGREGIYTVDATSLKSQGFEETSMN